MIAYQLYSFIDQLGYETVGIFVAITLTSLLIGLMTKSMKYDGI